MVRPPVGGRKILVIFARSPAIFKAIFAIACITTQKISPAALAQCSFLLKIICLTHHHPPPPSSPCSYWIGALLAVRSYDTFGNGFESDNKDQA